MVENTSDGEVTSRYAILHIEKIAVFDNFARITTPLGSIIPIQNIQRVENTAKKLKYFRVVLGFSENAQELK